MKLLIKAFLAFLFSGYVLIGDGQTKQPTGCCLAHQDSVLHKPIYNCGETLSEPVGGLEKLLIHITHDLEYKGVPGAVPGRIIVAFVVERNGKVDGERVIKAPYGFDDPDHLTKQIFSIVTSVKWRPGKCHNKKVAMLYTLPISLEFSTGE